jgi:hypothetical protein
MSVTVYGPGMTWPGHQKPHWRRALRQAREAGWTLKHLGAPHRFGVVVCPAGEHTFDVDSTARGAETKALAVPKLLRRCQHGGPTTTGSRVAERLERARRLLDRAEQLIGIAMEDLERVEAQHAALAELDRVELLLAAADKAVDEVLAAAQEEALERAAELEDAPGAGVIAQTLDRAEATADEAAVVVRQIRRSRPAGELKTQAETTKARIGVLRVRLADA